MFRNTLYQGILNVYFENKSNQLVLKLILGEIHIQRYHNRNLRYEMKTVC